MPARRIHILGASGSGTTTLGQSLSSALGCPHLDTDDFYWRKTDPPYTVKAPVEERLAGLGQALDRHPEWILTGSLVSWGEPLKARFTDILFLWIPWTVRQDRLLARKKSRHGDRIAPGGDMHALHLEFMDWASHYDEPDFAGRSRAVHDRWLSGLGPATRVHRLECAYPPAEILSLALKSLE